MEFNIESEYSPTDIHRFFLNNGLNRIALIIFLQELSEIDHELTMRSALLCQAKHHIVLSGDAFLRSVGAQALRGGLAKN